MKNKKDERYSHKSVGYSLSVSSKTYSVSNRSWEKDPFILLLDSFREEVKQADDEELSEIIEENAREIAVQAYLAEDFEVLHSLVRILDNASERQDERFGEEIIESIFNPHIVQIYEKVRPLASKIPVMRDVFVTKMPVDEVEIYRNGEKLGAYEGHILKILDGKYRFEISSEDGVRTYGLPIQSDREIVIE